MDSLVFIFSVVSNNERKVALEAAEAAVVVSTNESRVALVESEAVVKDWFAIEVEVKAVGGRE